MAVVEFPLSECIKRPLSGPTVKEHAMLESAAM